jgi:TRAP-type C4-dicarboxylate transport system permease large subunit
MKKFLYILSLFVCFLGLTSCQAIGDIFKAGVWVGVLAVIIVVAVIILVIAKARNR